MDTTVTPSTPDETPEVLVRIPRLSKQKLKKVATYTILGVATILTTYSLGKAAGAADDQESDDSETDTTS